MGKGTCDYISAQKQELLKSFFEHLGCADTLDEVIRVMVKSPCSRFWISSEYAMRYISLARQGKWDKVRRRKVIEAIMERCNGDYSRDKIEEVIYSPAPEFFLVPSSAKTFIYAEIKKRKDARQNS